MCVDMETELDMLAFIAWKQRFLPASDVHVQGGEPTLFPDFAKKAQLLIDTGCRVTVFSNAQNMTPELYALKANWIMSHKPHKQSEADFMTAIAPIDRSRLVLNRVYSTEDCREIDDDATERFRDAGYELLWIKSRQSFETLRHADYTGNPSERFIMVGRLGEVYECSCGDSPLVGNVYELTYIPDTEWRCKVGRYENGTCQACVCAEFFQQ